MKRKITKELFEWKNGSRGKSALLIEGARRVGKSYSVLAFAKEAYKSHILIDFNNAPKAICELFENKLHDLDSFFMYLSVIYGTRLYPRESVIVFDEVQLFPRARAAIKYLVADHRFDYIETGSLISIRENVRNIVIPSEERCIQMHPMDFEEFLWATSREGLWSLIQTAFANGEPLANAIHVLAMEAYRQYLLVGGMPQAVEEYRTSLDFAEVDQVKQSILHLYREDMEKQGTRQNRTAIQIFDSLPSQLKRAHKRFSPSKVRPGARMRHLQNALTWLCESMIVTPCYRAADPMIGFRANLEQSDFKCYVADTGLLISQAFDESHALGSGFYQKLLSGKLEVNEGMIAENMVAQMLTASGHRLYYYQNNSQSEKDTRMEIDFLLTGRDTTSRRNVSPIEVKSGKSRVTKSLDRFEKAHAQQCGTPYIVSRRNLEKDGSRIRLPFYMVPLL